VRSANSAIHKSLRRPIVSVCVPKDTSLSLVDYRIGIHFLQPTSQTIKAFDKTFNFFDFYDNADSNFTCRFLVAMNGMASLLRLTIYTKLKYYYDDTAQQCARKDLQRLRTQRSDYKG